MRLQRVLFALREAAVPQRSLRVRGHRGWYAREIEKLTLNNTVDLRARCTNVLRRDSSMNIHCVVDANRRVILPNPGPVLSGRTEGSPVFDKSRWVPLEPGSLVILEILG